MEFTYTGYRDLLAILSKANYTFANFTNYFTVNRPAIIRHDLDMSLPKALDLAELESMWGIHSTYFVLLSGDFYNVFSRQSNAILRKICHLGHSVALHFDEKKYPIGNIADLQKFVDYEIGILEQELSIDINVVSMHRPSRWILENDITLDGVINTYSRKFIHDFKYLSDSRMRWREDVVNIVENNQFDKLHLLTHPFWYAESNATISERLHDFLQEAPRERYYHIKNNFTDLNRIIPEEEFKW